jgi:hypothetical protein
MADGRSLATASAARGVVHRGEGELGDLEIGPRIAIAAVAPRQTSASGRTTQPLPERRARARAVSAHPETVWRAVTPAAEQGRPLQRGRNARSASIVWDESTGPEVPGRRPEEDL